MERDTCSVQLDSETGCSSAVDRLFELFVWQGLRFEGIPFRELVAFSSVLRAGSVNAALSACFVFRAAMFVFVASS